MSALDHLLDTSRRAPRLAGRGLIKAYRYTLSPLVGFHCRHLPTCSDYADQAIERYGLWAGGWMTLARLLRCHPWGTHGLDFVCDELPRGRGGICRGAMRGGAAPTRGPDRARPEGYAAARTGGAMKSGSIGVRTCWATIRSISAIAAASIVQPRTSPPDRVGRDALRPRARSYSARD